MVREKRLRVHEKDGKFVRYWADGKTIRCIYDNSGVTWFDVENRKLYKDDNEGNRIYYREDEKIDFVRDKDGNVTKYEYLEDSLITTDSQGNMTQYRDDGTVLFRGKRTGKMTIYEDDGKTVSYKGCYNNWHYFYENGKMKKVRAKLVILRRRKMEYRRKKEQGVLVSCKNMGR